MNTPKSVVVKISGDFDGLFSQVESAVKKGHMPVKFPWTIPVLANGVVCGGIEVDVDVDSQGEWTVRSRP